jgi:hypothetical protein
MFWSRAWTARVRQLFERLRPGQLSVWTAIDDVFRKGEPTETDLDHVLTVVNELDEERLQRITDLQSSRTELELKIPPSLVALTEQLQKADELQSALRQFENSSQRSAEKKARLDRREKWRVFIEKACRTFAKAELVLSTTETLALETRYRSFYEEITKNPDVVPLLKKAQGSEELHLRLAKFYGLSDLSATTLLPESYRNALGICIFLSAAERTHSAARFMVMDDVTSSFDAGHQFGLMELLRTRVALPGDPNGPQIILLSHDGLLEKYFDTVASTGTWNHQKLVGMAPQGAILSQRQGADRLRSTAEQFLNAGQTQQAGPLIRQHLEFSLLQVIRTLGIPVPLDFSIRDDRKTVENCLTVIGDAVDLHKRAGDLLLTPAQQAGVQSTYASKIIANWVSHYSTGTTASLSAYVLLGVLKDVDAYVDSFKYECSCSGGVQRLYYRSLTSKRCKC